MREILKCLSKALVLVAFFLGRGLLADVAVDARNLLLKNSNDVTLTAPETVYYNAPKTPSGNAAYSGYVTFTSSLTIEASKVLTLTDHAGWLLGSLIFGDAASTLDIGAMGMRCGALFSMTGPGVIQASGSAPGVMRLSGNLTLAQQFLISKNGGNGSVVIDGNGNTLTLAPGGQFYINYGGNGSPLTLRNMKLVLATTAPFIFYDGTSSASTLTLQDVDIYLDPSLTGQVAFASPGNRYGGLTIKGVVTINGPGKTLIYNSDVGVNTSSSSLYIDNNATLAINRGVTFNLTSDVLSREKKIFLASATSTLVLHGSTLNLPVTGLTSPGLQLERGRLVISGKVVLANEGNMIANRGLVLGDGSSSAQDVKARISADSQFVVDGYIFHNGA